MLETRDQDRSAAAEPLAWFSEVHTGKKLMPIGQSICEKAQVLMAIVGCSSGLGKVT